MRKLISPTDWLLLGLARIIDFMQEMKDPLHLFENYYKTYYGYVPNRFKKDNLYHLCWRNLRSGNIKKKVVKGAIYFELTSAGKEKIKRKYPLLTLQKKKWDGWWRIAVFDIEEQNKRIRDLFRRKLKELGFGQLQKSVWITPYDFLIDFREFLETHHLENNVVLIETENFYINDVKELAQRLWHLDELNDLYRKLYKDLIKFKSLKQFSDRVKILKTLREKVISVYLKDPHLPEEFLPDDWIAADVKRLIKQLKIF